MEQMVFWSIWGALGLWMFTYYCRCVHKIRAVLAGSGSGLAALLLLHYFGNVVGFVPEVNLFNLMQSVILGIPGVLLMTVLHFI